MLLDLLDKPPLDRTPADIDEIMKWCLDVPFFARGVRYSQFSKEVLRSICGELLVEDVDENQIVFRQGDVGDKFYVVYEGECSVLIDDHENDEMNREAAVLAKANTPLPLDPDEVRDHIHNEEGQTIIKMSDFTDDADVKSEVHQHEIDVAADKAREEIYLLRKHEHIDVEEHVVGCKGMVKVATIQATGSFGDLALMNDAPRSDYVVTKAVSIFLTLSRRAYQDCIRDYEKNMIEERMKILHHTPAFHSWPESDLQAISLLVTERRVEAREVIIKQGDPAT